MWGLSSIPPRSNGPIVPPGHITAAAIDHPGGI